MTKIKAMAATEARFPLAALIISEMNPRQEVPQSEVEELAESLWTAGLIQSLAGLSNDAGQVEIVAGGRRLRALRLLAERHPDLPEIRPELANPLVMLAPDAETALAWASLENVARRDLHPADEIRAYGKMAKTGAAAVVIARTFAVTEKHVYRRLALAALPAMVLDALAVNEISLSAAAAFTICNDEPHALTVLEKCRGKAWSDYQVKNALRPQALKDSDRRALFVGLDAYRAAGGGLTGDLFADVTYLDDTELLERLFAEKLDAAVANVVAMGWKWATARGDLTTFGWYERDQGKIEQLSRLRGELSEEQADRVDELAELAEGEALDEEGQAELEALQDLIDGDFSVEQKAVSGVVIYVDREGQIRTSEGLVRPEDKAAARAAGLIGGGNGDTEESKPKSPISNALAVDLARVVSGARQHAALRDPDLLLALLAYQLAGKTGYSPVFGLRTDEVYAIPSTAEDGYTLDDRLTSALTERGEYSWEDCAKGFRAMRKKGPEHVMAEITRHLSSLLIGGDTSMKALIDKEVKASTRAVWTPTAANLWNRVSGAYRQQVWRELLDLGADHPTATTFAKLKKAEQGDRLEKLFCDADFRQAHGVTEKQATRIDRWLPEGME